VIKIPILQVDAFTAEPFRGNPAGVCLLEEPAPEAWMQAVAAEMNLSETAFVHRQGDAFRIRYFTPLVEVPLCGHATLASAHVLWEERLVSRGTAISLQAQAGPLHASPDGDWICLDFPAYPVQEVAIPEGLPRALGAQPLTAHSGQNEGYLLEMDSEATIRALRPDWALLREGRFGAIIVTAPSSAPQYDFVSRFFAPDIGIDEDPVTGVAHCSLGPYWSERLAKRELVGHQVSKRGGVVRVRVRGERIDIMGQAVTVIRGELLAHP
jgi:predicted PhzF superfamily epimerase YddE/YHI9